MSVPGSRKKVVTAALAVVAAAAVAVAVVLLSTGSSDSGSGSSASTLVVLKDDIAPQMNPDGTNAAHPGVWDVFKNVYWRLVEYPTTKRGDIIVPNYKVNPLQFKGQLAQSYTKSGLTWTFKLRKGIKSCVGNEFTADDVVYTFQRAKSVSGASPVAWFLANVGSVINLDPLTSKAADAKEIKDEVVKVDDYTVRIKQFAPNELFPRVLEIFALNIFDSKEMKKQATEADPWAHDFANNKGAAGFGPYCVDRWAKGSEVTFTWNDNWPGEKAQFTNVVLRKVPQNANRVAAIKSGTADIVTTLTPSEFKNLGDSDGVKVLGWFNNQSSYIFINYKVAPWNAPGNEKLRKAVAYTIPYDDIIELDYNDTARRWPGMVVSTYNAYKPVVDVQTDLDMARQLMTEAGYPGGKGLEQYADAFLLTYPAERQSILEPVVNRIRTNMAAVGFPVKLNPVPQNEFSDRYLTKRDISMGLIDYGAAFGPDAGYAVQLFFVSVDKGGLNNGNNYSNPEVDALFSRALNATGEDRTRLMGDVQDLIGADMPQVPLYEFQTQIAVREDISGWLVASDNALAWYAFTTE